MGSKGFRTLGTALAFGLAVTLLTGTAATAHPDAMQHGEYPQGHLPPVQRGVDLIGALDLFPNDDQDGRIADVAGFGNYAYLGTFASPNCEDLGLYVVDISNPAAPRQVDFIPTTDPTSFVGEGVQVLDVDTQHFQGQLLIYSQETCPPNAGEVNQQVLGDPRLGFGGPGGATLVDVTEPEEWERLADHVGDNDPPPVSTSRIPLPPGRPHNSHSVFGWQQGDRAYMVVMDNGETGVTDLDFFDITDPSNPQFLFETGLSDWPQAIESPAPRGSTLNIHDFVVKQIDGRWLFLGSYWDAGYVILDVTNIGNSSLKDEERASYVRDTNFGAEDPLGSEMTPVLPAGMVPEGNAHQAEFNRDGSLFLATDEDFNPFRFTGVIDSGLYKGHSFTAGQGTATPPVDPDNGLTGPTKFIGQACAPVEPAPGFPSSNYIALIERGGPGGTCAFALKVQVAQNAGYKAAVIFNDANTDRATTCEAHGNITAAGAIPTLFVARSTGLKLLNVPNITSNTCDTPTPAVGTPSEAFTMSAVFDGWGYLHLYNSKTAEAVDHWALPESLEKENASGKGDLTIHEVATDPDLNNIAYSSHYAGGFRIFQFDISQGIREVGAYIDEGGNNFWGVEVVQHPKAGKIVLASDRDFGLYIFGPPAPDLTVGSITASKAPRKGQRVTLTATVPNVGSFSAENVPVLFLENGRQIGTTQTISQIEGGSSGQASVTWKPTRKGERTITVIVDATNAIKELDENNNSGTQVFTVQ
ncbi:MAG TPA: CARDB domain-containing protein [Actinomycetota bacterium]|nr:CARDB domain-containing protein [Actinomycetota bacterium]